MSLSAAASIIYHGPDLHKDSITIAEFPRRPTVRERLRTHLTIRQSSRGFSTPRALRYSAFGLALG